MDGIGHIFRWDVDKTYLRTEFDSVRDLVRTARMTAEERENIPGSAALIRSLKRGESHANNQVYFISGSPEQLRAVLEKKFKLDGFEPDGFVLKPAMSMLLRGRFRAIRSQVPYKLGALLRGRANAPIGSKETLFGDDAESDAFVYSLYADVVSGEVDDELVFDLLKKAGAYGEQADSVRHELEGVVHEPCVDRIVIHLDQSTPPATFADYFPRVVPIYNHLQTAIVLYLDGNIPAAAIRAVSRELIAAHDYDAERLSQTAEDILRRQRLRYVPGEYDRLITELRDLPEIEPAKTKKGRLADERAIGAIDRIVERAQYVQSRPLPKTVPPKAGPLDYIELFAKEVERREESKRAKKLAAKQRR